MQIVFLLDRSGSMDSIKDDTIGGFNTFLKGHQKAEGQATFTLIQFDTYYEIVYLNVDIHNAKLLTEETFTPRGSTALLDAIGRTIVELRSKADQNILFVILTDGLENSSREYNTKQIADMITKQIDAGWQFVYLGANQDAVLTGARMGFNPNETITFDANPKGVQNTYNALLRSTLVYRNTGTLEFTDTDRKMAQAQ